MLRCMDDVRDPRAGAAPFGLAVAVALLAGVAACLRLPALPPVPWMLVVLALGMLAWWYGRRLRLPGVLACGLALAALHASAALALRLPVSLEGDDIVVAGRVVDLPREEPGRTRFRFRVDDGHVQPEALRGRLLQLSWYTEKGEAEQGSALQPGSRWRLHLRLRAPRGLRNPGTRDTEKRALAARIAATGYVRDPALAQQLAPARGIDAWRARMSGRIASAVPSPSSRFVRALALGDTRGLDDGDWTTLRAAGLTHLIAISGFHVGMVAGFFALLATAAWWLLPSLGRRLPRMHAAAIAALLGACGYAAIAGFALPTVRTVLMIALVVLARLLRRAQRAVDALALAAIAVLLADPLSVLAPGFWLSFGGVAWLLWCLPGNDGNGWRALLRGFVGAQAVATFGLLPLMVMLFGQASLAGPIANLVAIPWWSLVVVPLALCGTALEAAHAGLGELFWRLAAWAFDLAWPGFQWLAGSPLSLWWLPQPAWFAVPLALAGAVWVLLPRGVPGKPLALLLWLPLLWPQRHLPAPGEAELVVIDVGQGLSVLVRTARHALLYDMGAARPDGFDAGADVVVPTLHALGVRGLDVAVVSHGDNDHAGGYPAVMQAFPALATLGPEGMWAGIGTCRAGMAWNWDGVAFRFLHPPHDFPYLDNESSCVLRVQAAGGPVALFTGDIDDVVERRLVRRERPQLRADVVLVAHHGSKGSSDPAFIAATGAHLALVSAGHGNRFHHPHPDTVARWHAAGARVETTLDTGAQRVRLGASGITFSGEREGRRRLWDAAILATGVQAGRDLRAGTGEGGRLADDPAAVAVGRRAGDHRRAVLVAAGAGGDAARTR
jgi:competence protein ComEC